MKLKTITALAALMFIGIHSVSAQAGVRTRNQHARIRQGVKSGELTKAEAANVRHDQKEIREEKRDARADGTVTPQERQEIRQDQRQASRKLYRKKHNNRDRN